MKKNVMTILIAGLALASTTVMAGQVKDNCGCGFGTMALGEETGLLSHLAATFLNGISGNQTFGISSGTLNCEQAKQLVSVQEVEIFVADNMDHIATEAAMGEGAYLSALADLLNVQEQDRARFYTSMQVNFDQIFTGSDVRADEVTRSIVKMI
ncbi:MAG: DUF3015 family protein [Kiritimatiellae bacterium]|nr:DUF3015 family protein [Kiritimatiellia bacterium]